tara:strand:+ start:509 stop:1021 length:513 start_codon:yes stop_codon:yes gene_type:complete
MDWIVTTGVTVEEALESALDELSVTSDDVEYQVLKEPKKTFLGLRNTQAQIKTRVRPVAAPAKRERRRPARSEKRKRAKSQRPKTKMASEKQRQQRSTQKQRPQPNRSIKERTQASNSGESPAQESSTRKRTLTSEGEKNGQSNTRSINEKKTGQTAANKTARRVRKIDH